ncbi:1288_t:CDS:2, partial [Gigaspora rosea]
MTVTGNSNSTVSNNRTFNSTSKRDKKDDDDFDNKQEIKRTKFTTPPQPLYKIYNLRPPTEAPDIENLIFSSASTNISYVPCFDSPASEISIKTKKPYYIDYLVGLGIVEWELTEVVTRWIVKGVDISIICAEYRASIIKKCEARTRLNSDEEL